MVSDEIIPNVTPLETVSAAPEFRQPPHNIQAEQALLGAILMNNRAFEKVTDFLEASHFFDPVHARIYEACARLIERGQIANPVTLKNIFDQDEGLAQLNGAQYLTSLVRAVVTVVNAEDYGHLIRDCYLRRSLIDIGETVVNDAYAHDAEDDAVQQIEIAESKLFSLAESGVAEGGFRPFASALASSIEMAEAAFKRDGGLAGVSTGLTDLDRKLGGLHPSDLIVLAGRPAMGKTALATNIAFHVATAALDDPKLDREVVAFFSLEMSAEQLATRILAEQTEISSEKIRRGELSNDDFHKLVRASQRLERAPLYIDDTPAITIAQLRTRVRRLMRQHGLSLIVVDYLQLMRPGAGARRQPGAGNPVPVAEAVAGVQCSGDGALPAQPGGRTTRGQTPGVGRFAQIGSIERDSDVVCLSSANNIISMAGTAVDEAVKNFSTVMKNGCKCRGSLR